MTTTDRPTPADLARRPGPPRRPASEAPAAPAPPQLAQQRRPRGQVTDTTPGTMRKGDPPLRALYLQGMRISRLNANTRLVGITLVGYANFQSGLLRTDHMPTPEELSYATGLTVGQVLTQIEILTQRGWLTECQPECGPNAGTKQLKLTVPVFVLTRLRRRAAEGLTTGETSGTEH